MGKKSVRIDVNIQQLSAIRMDVFCNSRLSEEQRRRAVRRIMPIPSDGSRVDLYYEGKYVGTIQ